MHGESRPRLLLFPAQGNGPDHALPNLGQRREPDRQRALGQESFQSAQAIGNAAHKVALALVESPVAIGAEGLHQAQQGVGPVEAQKGLRLEGGQTTRHREVMVQQLIPQGPGQVRLGVQQQGGHVVLQRALSPPLVVDAVEPFPETT